MSSTELVQRLREQTATLPVLGFIVWWTLTKVEVHRDEFELRLKLVGLDPNLMPGTETAGALRKALDALGSDKLIRRVVDDEDRLAYALVDENVDEKLVDVDYRAVQIATYHRTTKQLTFKNGYANAEITALFDRYVNTLTANEVRRTILNAIEAAQGVMVRPTGGVYFVPRDHETTVSKLELLVAGFANDSCVVALGITDTNKARAGMLKIVAAEINTELTAVESDVRDLLTRTNTRTSTLQRRLDEFKRVREKARTYADLLTYEAHEVENRIRALETQVQNAL